ncbi:hypothetical protein LR393_17780, partial [Kineosporia mesophila]
CVLCLPVWCRLRAACVLPACCLPACCLRAACLRAACVLPACVFYLFCSRASAPAGREIARHRPDASWRQS